MAIVLLRANDLQSYAAAFGRPDAKMDASLRLHFGIGQAATIDSVEIRWPSGVVQKESPAINKITKVTEKQ